MIAQNSRPGSLASLLEKHFGRCAALAAAGVGGGYMMSAPQHADAAIIYSGTVNINIPSTTAGVYLNLVTGVNNPSPGLVPGWDVNPWSASNLSFFNPTAPSGGVYVVAAGVPTNLAPGTLISAASTYGSGVADSTFNLNSSNNLVGIRLQDETNANQTDYGWLRISLDATQSAQPRAIVEYAYDNSGAGIQAGQVPEPASLSLLALGAAGLLKRRRQTA